MYINNNNKKKKKQNLKDLLYFSSHMIRPPESREGDAAQSRVSGGHSASGHVHKLESHT